MICTEKLPVPNIRGGAIQTYIGGVAGLLSKHHSLTILGRTDPDLPNDEVVNGIRYVRVPSDGLLDVYAEGVVDFVTKFGSKFDLIHIFNRPKLVLSIRKAAPRARIILSMHNDMFNSFKIHPSEGAAVIDQTERILTISNYVGNEVAALFPNAKGKLKTIYSGVDLNRFSPWTESEASRKERETIRSEFGLGSKKVILFVGRLSRNKGPHVLVKAMSQISHKDAALVVVGGAWYSDNSISDYVAYVRALAEKSPIPVITTGYVQSHEVHRWFNAGDLFVCTSLWQEPLARVHYEAMAAGLPFLTTERGGNPEITAEPFGKLIHNPEDPAEYAQKLNVMLSDLQSARRNGLQGRRLAEKNFTWDRVARDILTVWQQ